MNSIKKTVTVEMTVDPKQRAGDPSLRLIIQDDRLTIASDDATLRLSLGTGADLAQAINALIHEYKHANKPVTNIRGDSGATGDVRLSMPNNRR